MSTPGSTPTHLLGQPYARVDFIPQSVTLNLASVHRSPNKLVDLTPYVSYGRARGSGGVQMIPWRKERMERLNTQLRAYESACIQDWNMLEGNKQVGELAQHHADSRGRKVNETFSLPPNFSYKAVCRSLSHTTAKEPGILSFPVCYTWLIAEVHLKVLTI